MSRIATLLECTPLELAGSGRRLLSLGDRVLASLPDTDRLTALVVHLGPGSSLAELVAMLAAGRPSGVAVVGNADGSEAVALALHDGLVVGATATGRWQTLGDWCVEFRRRLLGSVVAATGRHFDPARTFVNETVLGVFARFDEPGTSFALVSGELQWLDDRLDVDLAPSLGHLLLEHARRSDELPRIEAKIEGKLGGKIEGKQAGGLDRVIVPLAPPGERAARPTQKMLLVDEAESGWDFFDDPDPAAEAEWSDARRIFELCDGLTNIAGIVERSMLGSFRTHAALLALMERSHIELMAPFEVGDEAFDLIDALDDVG